MDPETKRIFVWVFPGRPCLLPSSLYMPISIHLHQGRPFWSPRDIYGCFRLLLLVAKNIEYAHLSLKGVRVILTRSDNLSAPVFQIWKKRNYSLWTETSKIGLLGAHLCIKLHQWVESLNWVFNGVLCSPWLKDGGFFRFLAINCPIVNI